MTEHIDPTASVEAARILFSTENLNSSIRLDAFLAQSAYCIENSISRERIKEYIQKGLVSCGEKILYSASYKVKEGMDISLSLPKEESTLMAEEGEIQVLYEDNHILIINKDINTVVHPCASHPNDTLLQKILFHYPDIRSMGGERPGIVHRLDKDTSGLLIVARTEKARQQLIHDFATHTIKKQYLALVEGITKEEGTIDAPIGRDPISKVRMCVLPNGKRALSYYKRIQTMHSTHLKETSFISVTIETGRTHQIRVHCSFIGHPLLGDLLYKGIKTEDYSRPMLHAYLLSFQHPITKELCSFTVPPPNDFINAFLATQKKPLRVVITGSAGSGKSTFLEYFTEEDIPTWSADAVAEKLYAVGGSGWHYLYTSYGNRFIKDENSSVDRKKLLQAFVESPSLRKEIEKTIHYYVLEDLKLFWNTVKHPYSIAEIPLFFELELDKKKLADISICTHITEEQQRKRLQEKGWSEEKITYCIQQQEASAIKCAKSTYVLENTSNKKAFLLAIKKMKTILDNMQKQEEKKKKALFFSLLKTL